MIKQQHIHFIINPVAGSGNNELKLKAVHRVLDPKYYSVTLKYSDFPKHATALTLDSIQEGASIIVACGGDGTINEIASCLVNTPVVLGIIPMGSGNGLASNLYIPKNKTQALGIIKEQAIKKIDVGRFNENYFFSNAGLGIAAKVIKHYEASEKRKFSSYLKASLKSFQEMNDDMLINVTANNQSFLINPLLLFISNSNELGYNVSLTPKASLQDGLLDIILVPKTNKLRTLLFGFLMLFKKHHLLKEVQSIQVKSAELANQNNDYFHSQIDGEYYTINNKLISIGILENSLQVIA